jgi:hypothetical protein
MIERPHPAGSSQPSETRHINLFLLGWLSECRTLIKKLPADGVLWDLQLEKED